MYVCVAVTNGNPFYRHKIFVFLSIAIPKRSHLFLISYTKTKTEGDDNWRRRKKYVWKLAIIVLIKLIEYKGSTIVSKGSSIESNIYLSFFQLHFVTCVVFKIANANICSIVTHTHTYILHKDTILRIYT